MSCRVCHGSPRHQGPVDRGGGGFKRGGFPIWTSPSFFLSLFLLFWDFPDFQDFPDLFRDFPVGPFPLSRPINFSQSTEGTVPKEKGLRHSALTAQSLKKFKIALLDWNFQVRLKISSEPPTKPLFFLGGGGGILKVKIEFFKRDWKFQARLNFFNLWALRVGTPPGFETPRLETPWFTCASH